MSFQVLAAIETLATAIHRACKGSCTLANSGSGNRRGLSGDATPAALLSEVWNWHGDRVAAGPRHPNVAIARNVDVKLDMRVRRGAE